MIDGLRLATLLTKPLYLTTARTENLELKLKHPIWHHMNWISAIPLLHTKVEILGKPLHIYIYIYASTFLWDWPHHCHHLYHPLLLSFNFFFNCAIFLDFIIKWPGSGCEVRVNQGHIAGGNVGIRRGKTK